MKKIINKPETVVPEMCNGLVLTHPELEYLKKYKIIKKRKLNLEKVTVISGGGSGHEPAHAGFVGHGMLDAAICGDVFASPSQVQVYQGLKATAGNKGTLMIIKNYSGDIMNFKNGAAMAAEEGIDVDYVKVEDDIAVNDSLYTVGRRGVAGTVLVHKVAGAAAEEGKNLQEVKELAQHAADSVRTIGFAYSSCTVPASGVPTFEIKDDEMEYGVGIHGEPGRSREKIASADETASRMVEQLIEELALTEEDEVSVLINGFGATPLQELYILNYAVSKALSEKKLVIYRSFAGNYMTSIDMAGASVTIMKMDDILKKYIDSPCTAPGFTVDGPLPQLPVYEPLEAIKKGEIPQEMTVDDKWRVIAGEHLTLDNITAMVKKMAECIIENEVNFCKLDSYAGDGDFGMSVAKGFLQVKQEWNDLVENKRSNIKEFLLSCAMIIMEHCGGASGPVWGSAFRGAALTAGEKEQLSLQEFADIMQAAVKGIQTTGERSFGRGAVVGDKTLIDALVPCADALSAGALENKSIMQTMKSAAEAAKEGAESTKAIVARMGRAGTVGERSLGYPDAGAYALGIIFTAITEYMEYR